MKTRTIIFAVCLLIVNMLFSGALFSQNINGKLAVSGQFIIRDTTNTFLTVPQSTGNLTLNRSLVLPLTATSTEGVIFKGTYKFLHNYGSSNTFLGIASGDFTLTGIENTAVGQSTLNSLTTGNENSAFGTYSLGSNSTGNYNSAFGRRSMNNNTTGVQNSAFGWDALYSNTTGFQNTAVGNSSLLYNTGNYNTALGYNAGSTITTGANLTCIGIDAAPTTPTALNQITLGNIYVTSLRCNVQTITSLSDARDKRNITNLSQGLEFIMKLKPRQFNWDKREWYDNNVSDGSKMQEAPTAGFIAQELDEVQTTEQAQWLNLVLKDNPDKWEATYGNLLPVVVKAVQDLKSEKDNEIAELKSENKELKNEIESLKDVKEKLAKLEKTQNELINFINSNKNDEVLSVNNK